MTKQFEINPYDLHEIGSKGYGSISVRIDGNRVSKEKAISMLAAHSAREVEKEFA